ncbi:glycosyl hydrolase 115 family protein [Massilia sp. IC2-477]|uniref:glycosyl hydrolase 115 family protein n=1 Tax=Massilia sp. IC2-477 TaxID=2887198 RepID=UPI001D1054E2|nr:glycosyl hydrolase 115 family protein [Massilia sp. IC2-477]MCC2954882.1 glycosyl hydrolase 115 family protein [Massilia sp. IC2-477]
MLCSLALGLCLALPAKVHALGTPRFVDLQGKEGVRLVAGARAAPIVVDKDDFPGVLRAARDLQRDLQAVTGRTPQWQTGAAAGSDAIIVGTLGRHALIDALARQGKIDTRSLAGQWEGFLIQAVTDPVPGVKRALVIAGSDKRGTIYGIYTLSEQIGVSPWHWWADVPVARHAALSVPLDTRLMDKPAVQYRGIFLNDEAPALTNWAKERFGGFNRKFYERIFELMLRLRANYLWPAMWGSAFYDDDKSNGELADSMGIVMGTSHHEPMMRAQQEWARHGKGPWDYSRNADTLRDFWAGGLRNTRDYEKVITMAMRGDGDEPMSESANVDLLERIVRDQRALIQQELGRDPASVPQLWALYKEVQDYYEKGMRVPDDMLLLWCDDNWGNIRRLPTPEERKRSGGAGVYYHFDYVGGPRSYKWLNVTQIAKVWEQMNLANEYGANRLWIVNVGDLKPMEVPTEFFLAYAWNPSAWPADKLPAYLEAWAAREFGTQHAGRIAAIVERYTRYNARRRPEQLAPDTYSLTAYDEAERVVNDYNALVLEAQQVGKALPKAVQDAYFQLVEYPVRASANALEMWVSAGRNAQYARQGRASTNDMAARVRRLFAHDAELTRAYHGARGGKWKHMMSQTRFGYTNWAQPYRDVMPAVAELRLPDPASPGGIGAADRMGVVVQGSQAVWPAYGLQHMTLPALDVFERQPRYLELFNRSREPFEYAVKASHPWIRLSHAMGRIDKEQRILVDVDWDAVPAGRSEAELTVSGPDGDRVTIKVPVHKPADLSPQSAQGHVESRGVVAIEAENFSREHAPGGRGWLRIPGYGQTLSGMTTTPGAAPALTPADGMRLEYDVHLFRGGELKLHAVLGPALKFQPGKGFRFAVSIDDGPVQEVNVHADESEQYWNRMVSDGVAKFTTTHRIERPGRHTVKFWALDPGLVLQRLVIDAGGLQPSYLGPPESPYYPVREAARP